MPFSFSPDGHCRGGARVVATVSSESWTDAQQDPCAPTDIQGFAEHTRLPADRENCEDKDLRTPSTRSRTSVRTTTWQLLEAWQQQGDHPNILVRVQRRIVWISLSSWIVPLIASARACTQRLTHDRLEKRIDERISSKLGPVMDRLSALENTDSITRSGPSSMSDLTKVDLLPTMVGAAAHRSRYLLLIWRSMGGVDFETGTHMV